MEDVAEIVSAMIFCVTGNRSQSGQSSRRPLGTRRGSHLAPLGSLDVAQGLVLRPLSRLRVADQYGTSAASSQKNTHAQRHTSRRYSES